MTLHDFEELDEGTLLVVVVNRPSPKQLKDRTGTAPKRNRSNIVDLALPHMFLEVNRSCCLYQEVDCFRYMCVVLKGSWEDIPGKMVQNIVDFV